MEKRGPTLGKNNLVAGGSPNKKFKRSSRKRLEEHPYEGEKLRSAFKKVRRRKKGPRSGRFAFKKKDPASW